MRSSEETSERPGEKMRNRGVGKEKEGYRRRKSKGKGREKKGNRQEWVDDEEGRSESEGQRVT